MSKYITIKEYAQQQGVTERTVYRWVTNNDIEVKKVKGVLHVKIDGESDDKDELIFTLKSESCHLREQIEYLQRRLEQAQETIDTMQQRSDTIIMQLTKQLEQQTLLLEDLRQRSIWQRLKKARIMKSLPCL
jgi:excisionase family DNA binding protein